MIKIWNVEYCNEGIHWSVEAPDSQAAMVEIFGDMKFELVRTVKAKNIYRVYDDMGFTEVSTEVIAWKETITRVPVQQQGYSTTVVHGAKK